jgi:hypothetical protein
MLRKAYDGGLKGSDCASQKGRHRESGPSPSMYGCTATQEVPCPHVQNPKGRHPNPNPTQQSASGYLGAALGALLSGRGGADSLEHAADHAPPLELVAGLRAATAALALRRGLWGACGAFEGGVIINKTKRMGRSQPCVSLLNPG